MGDLKLTPQERALVDAMAGPHQLVPVMIFMGYGLWQWGVPALAVGILGLLIFLGWRFSREFSGLQTHLSLYRKVAEHERNGDRRLRVKTGLQFS